MFMLFYAVIAAIVAVIAGILLAACTKKAEDVTYGKLDKAGRITNILLIPIYVFLSPLYLALGMFSAPAHEGFLGILGWIVSVIIASGALPCGIGLGMSVALRKKGRSRLSFAVQFAGFAGILLSVALYCLLAGNLLQSLN